MLLASCQVLLNKKTVTIMKQSVYIARQSKTASVNYYLCITTHKMQHKCIILI